jgi:hypothetical protein
MRPWLLSRSTSTSAASHPCVFEEAFNLSTQCRLVGLDGEKIAGACVLDRGRNRSIGGDGADGDQRALDALALGEAFEKHGDSGDLVAPRLDGLLAEHEPARGGESRGQMQRSLARRPVMAAARGLAVDGDGTKR